MNDIAAHKDELQKLLGDLSSDRLVSRIKFRGVGERIYRAARRKLPGHRRFGINPPPAQTDGESTSGTNIDSNPDALLRARYHFRTARRALPLIWRCGPQASARCPAATAARGTFQVPATFPEQRPLTDVD